jgi:phosphatidylinositol-3-phosphatase
MFVQKHRLFLLRPPVIAPVMFSLALATVGGVLLLTSRAATPVSSLEAEGGILAGTDSAVSDTTASGSHAVKFGTASATGSIKTVFTLAVENRTWSTIVGSNEWPYLNSQLLKGSAGNIAWANNFNTGLHPSLPNYIAMEAASPEGLNGNGDAQPNTNPINDNHLTKELNSAGLSWRYFGENLPGGGTSCFLNDAGSNARKPYSLDHAPFAYFTDIQTNSVCLAHIRPFQELCGALGYPAQATQSAQWASPCTNTSPTGISSPSRYNFIVPNDWDQGEHLSTDPAGGGSAAMAMPSNPNYPNNGQGCGACQSDFYLSQIVPIIVNSPAYKNGNSALFIIFDEADEGVNAASGMMVVSPYARNGYSNTITYQGWSSYVRTMQEIFGVTPFINGASSVIDFSDLFTVGL